MYPWWLIVGEIVFLVIVGVLVWFSVAVLRKILPVDHPVQTTLVRFDDPSFTANFVEIFLAVTIAATLVTVTLVYS